MASGDPMTASDGVSRAQFMALEAQLSAALERLSVLENRQTPQPRTPAGSPWSLATALVSPTPATAPAAATASINNEASLLSGFDLIFYDLETTGLGKTINIAMTQIGATKIRVGTDGTWSVLSSWSSYVMPWKDLTSEAETVSGLSYKKLEQLKARAVREVLPEFNQFINGDGTTRAILIGHNSQRYDSRILFYELARSKMSLSAAVLYFSDTLALLPYMCPTLIGSSLKLANIYKWAFPNETTYTQQHDAMADANDTTKIFMRLWGNMTADIRGTMDLPTMLRHRPSTIKVRLMETVSQWQARVGREPLPVVA